jgi:hypothetical protein
LDKTPMTPPFVILTPLRSICSDTGLAGRFGKSGERDAFLGATS